MKHIILICAAGMSTSLLVNKMKSAASEEGKEVHIEAMSANIFATYQEPVDVLLLGPQISFLEEEMRTTYEPKGSREGKSDYTSSWEEHSTVYQLSLHL